MNAASFPPPIAALRRGPGSRASEVVAAFALRRRDEGVAIAGVISPAGEDPHGSGGAATCECRGALLDLATGESVNIHQDLGPGSEACNLDSSALARACGSIERAIAGGAALVVLNRFGGQEMQRGGLTAAFQAAVAAGVPVVCTVAPRAEAIWEAFAEGMFTWVPAEAEALEAWWQDRVRPARQAA